MTQALPEQVVLDVRSRREAGREAGRESGRDAGRDSPDLELERAYADRLAMLRRGRPSPQSLAASDLQVRELELRLMTSAIREEGRPRMHSAPSPSQWWG
jgi:hypothetical protein